MPTRNPPDKHLNLNVRGMGHSATVAINQRSNDLRASGQRIFKLGLGQSPFPVPERVVQALRDHAREKDYLPVTGLPALRKAIADYTKRVTGIERSSNDVLIGPGSKELMFLLQLVYYGDLVVPTPAWVSYAPQARIIGRTVRLIPSSRDNGWRITPDGFEQLCSEDVGRPRVVILNYPSNPTGGTYKLEELKALAKVAQKHRVVLLSDEIYGEVHHKGQHVSIARFYPEGTIISNGLSKWCGAGGWRLGYFILPPSLRWLLEAMASAASETFTSTSAPIQYAAVTAFQQYADVDEYLVTSRRVLRALGRWIWRQLNDAEIFCHEPAGAFYLFPDFEAHREGLAKRGVHNSSQLCERLLDDTGVAILPGDVFGRPSEELTARLAYVDFDGSAALEAADEVKNGGALDDDFLRHHCGNVMTAIERMCEWAQG